MDCELGGKGKNTVDNTSTCCVLDAGMLVFQQSSLIRLTTRKTMLFDQFMLILAHRLDRPGPAWKFMMEGVAGEKKLVKP